MCNEEGHVWGSVKTDILHDDYTWDNQSAGALYSAAVPKVHSVDPFGSMTSSHGIRGYIYVIDTLKFTYFN